MRFEKTYDGVKTVLEGQELQNMLTQFSGYNLKAVKRRFETDDLTLAMKMTCFKVYADLYPDFKIDRDKINNKQGADNQKADLLYRVVLYLTVKCLYPVVKPEVFFDGQPSLDGEAVWTGPGGYFKSLSQTTTLEKLLSSALKQLETLN